MAKGGFLCVKYLLAFFNFIFLLSGIGIIVCGALVEIRFRDYLTFIGKNSVAAPLLLIAIGILAMIIAFLGCCGAIKESYGMLMAFSSILILIFICELAGGIVAYVFMKKIEVKVKTEATKTLIAYRTDKMKIWDKVQEDMKCCGIESYKDWSKNPQEAATESVPDSCCLRKGAPELCGKGLLRMNTTMAAKKIYTNGCHGSLVAFMKKNAYYIGAVGIGIAFVQLIGIVLACVFAHNLRRSSYDQV